MRRELPEAHRTAGHRTPTAAARPPRVRGPRRRVHGLVAAAVLAGAVLALALTAGGALAAPADAAGNPTGAARSPAGPPEASVLDGSTVSFRVTDQLESFSGHAPVAAATLRVDPARPATARGSVTVRAAAITTGNLVRDRNAARGVFETERYPLIRYTITDVQADPAGLPSGATAHLVVTGTLALHGTTRKVVAQGTVHRNGDRLDAKLRFDVHLSAFGMERPRFLFLQVDDLVTVQVDLALQSSASP